MISKELYEKYKGGFCVSFPGDTSGMAGEEWLFDKERSDDDNLCFIGYDANLFPMPDFKENKSAWHKYITIEKALAYIKDYNTGKVFLDSMIIKDNGKELIFRERELSFEIKEFLGNFTGKQSDKDKTRREKIREYMDSVREDIPLYEKRKYMDIKDLRLPKKIRRTDSLTELIMHNEIYRFRASGEFSQGIDMNPDGTVCMDRDNAPLLYTALFLNHKKIRIK